MLHVRICAGGRSQGRSLPRQRFPRSGWFGVPRFESFQRTVRIFEDDNDYKAFELVMVDAFERTPMRTLEKGS
jgi:hypothetical protein